MYSKLRRLSRLQWFFILLGIVNAARIVKLGAGDFTTYYEAAKLVRTGQQIYCIDFAVGSNWLGYAYTPFFAFILIPFTYMPLWAADFIWLLLSFGLLWRIFYLIEDFLDIRALFSLPLYRWWIFFILLFSARFILYNFDTSQVTILMLWAALESVRLIQKKHWLLGGVLLSFAISIKFLPLVVLPYLFWRRWFRAGFSTIFGIIMFSLSPVLIYGLAGFAHIIAEWQRVLDPSSAEFTLQQNFISEGLHSLTAWIPAFFTDAVPRFGLRRHFFALSDSDAMLLLRIAQGFFVVLSWAFFRSLPFKKEDNKRVVFWELSYLLLVVPLIFPHQQKYAFIFLIPAFAWFWYVFLYFWQENTKKNFYFWQKITNFGILKTTCIIIVWLLMTASTDGIVGRELYKIGQYYKLITWGAMLLIPLLWLEKPEKMVEKADN